MFVTDWVFVCKTVPYANDPVQDTRCNKVHSKDSYLLLDSDVSSSAEFLHHVKTQLDSNASIVKGLYLVFGSA